MGSRGWWWCSQAEPTWLNNMVMTAEPSRLLDRVHGTVYLSSPLTARHLSPSRNTSRLIYLVYLFRARIDCVKCPCSSLRRCNFVKLHYISEMKWTIQALSLEERHNRADLLEEVFKLEPGDTQRRCQKYSSKLKVRKYFFSEWIVNRRNKLSQDDVDQTSVNSFKRKAISWDGLLHRLTN